MTAKAILLALTLTDCIDCCIYGKHVNLKKYYTEFQNFHIFAALKTSIMSEISRFYGIIITMYFPDHNPPHFHVRYNEFRALIDISTGKMTGSMSRRALEFVYEWMDLHKDEL